MLPPGFLACDCSRLCSPPGSYYSPVTSSVCCFRVSGVPGFHVFSFPSLGFLKLVSHLSGFSCSVHFLFSGINKRHVSFTTFPLHTVTLTGVRCQKKRSNDIIIKNTYTVLSKHNIDACVRSVRASMEN